MIDVIWNESIEPNEAIEKLLTETANTALRLNDRTGGVCILITDAEEIQQLNRDFRDIDKVTDVLSFPAVTEDDASYLGDLAICLSRAEEQAETYGHGLDRELAFLTAHGCLHLMGFDHMIPEEETVMRRHQNEIMKEMGLQVHD